jgi:large subunit ribosomal protein L23
MLKVNPKANKPLIKQAIEKLFEVKIEKINISVRKGKKRRSGKKTVIGNTKKIAIVVLKEGHSLDLFKQTKTYAQKP